MDDTIQTPIHHGSDLVTRLDEIETRLVALARAEPPVGLTEPDAGGTERWEAAQVWGHIAEFVPYWHTELKTVIGGFRGSPIPFGRTKTDSGRIAGIETGRHAPIPTLMEQTRTSIADLKSYLGRLTPAEWKAMGLHPIRGEMAVSAIVERFVVGHLEEHADQLDSLR